MDKGINYKQANETYTVLIHIKCSNVLAAVIILGFITIRVLFPYHDIYYYFKINSELNDIFSWFKITSTEEQYSSTQQLQKHDHELTTFLLVRCDNLGFSTVSYQR